MTEEQTTGLRLIEQKVPLPLMTESSSTAGRQMGVIRAPSSTSSAAEAAPDYFSGRGPPMRRYVDFLKRCGLAPSHLFQPGYERCALLVSFCSN